MLNKLLNYKINNEGFYKNIPNIISLSRLFLVFPLIILLEANRTKYIVFLIIIAGLTDYFDGFLREDSILNQDLEQFLIHYQTKYFT